MDQKQEEVKKVYSNFIFFQMQDNVEHWIESPRTLRIEEPCRIFRSKLGVSEGAHKIGDEVCDKWIFVIRY